MGVELKKGGNVNLSKEAPGLNHITVGLGWDSKPAEGSGYEFDLDISGFLLKSDGKVRSDKDFCYFKQLECAFGVVSHSGDNLTGEGDGDDERIKIALSLLPEDVVRIPIAANIYEAEERKQVFGQVNGAYVRIINDDNGVEVARFDLSEDASIDTGMVFGEIYRSGDDWKFKAIAQGFEGGLGPIARSYGVNVE